MTAKKAKEYLQVGEVARILEIAPRTVRKWFDAGKITGYRFPPCGRQGDEGVRRIHRESLRRFMAANNIPLPAELRTEKVILLISSDVVLGRCLATLVTNSQDRDLRLRSAIEFWSAAEEYVQTRPALVIFDARLGRTEALMALARIRERGDCVCLIGVANEDDDQLAEWGLAGCDLFKRPFDPDLLVSRVQSLLSPQIKEKQAC